MFTNFNQIWRKSLSGQRETTMALHEDKFEYICHLANKRSPLHQLPFAHEHFQYTTSTGNILTPVDQLRDLGITVSKDLSWTSHIRSSCDKARKMAAWVFIVFRTRNRIH